MGKKITPRSAQQPARREPQIDYPTLNDHRASRRRFLAGSAVVLGAGAVAACARPFWSDHEVDLDGAMPEPEFYTLRFPAAPDDRAVYPMDGGYVRFYVTALTYCEDCSFFAIDNRAGLTDQMALRVGERFYDELTTSGGVAALQDELRDLLDEAYNADTGDIATGWFVDVEVTFTRMDAPDLLGGFAGDAPSYP